MSVIVFIFKYRRFFYLLFQQIKKMTTNYNGQEVKRNFKPATFLKKIYSILRDNSNEDVVRWGTDGIGFVIKNQISFEKEVLPKYFKHGNYSSFIRQLNMYNFHKIRQNSTQSYFRHQSFTRDNQAKLAEIKRKQQKKKPLKKCQNQTQENKEINLNKATESHQPNFPKGLENQISTNYTKMPLNQTKIKEDNNIKQIATNEQQQEKVSINNDIPQRTLPQVTGSQYFYQTNTRIFSIAMIPQPSTFCFFY